MGKVKLLCGDYMVLEDDNMLVKGIGGDCNVIGYLLMLYYVENKKMLKVLVIIGGLKVLKKIGVLLLKELVEDGIYYLLVCLLLLYVSVKLVKCFEVIEFINFYLKNVQVIVFEVKYVVFLVQVYILVQDYFVKGKIGMVFVDGYNVGIKIEEFLKKEVSYQLWYCILW